ncbi:MAG TPA: hypothetical protein VLX90_14300 [Steroidobacteraceae bacterium]|nr:hypothetical protein [Steroidobacteraceae bacterium]
MPRKRTLLHTVTTMPQSEAASDSPAQPPALGAWGGHLHATRVALAMIFRQAPERNGTLGPKERILATVCDLRSALACGEWLGRLGTNCLKELAAARFALNEVGAMSVAAYISDTLAALRRADSVQDRQSLLSKLEWDLNAAGPTLDRLIARFAQSLLDAGGGAPQSSRTTRLEAAGRDRNHWSNSVRDMTPCGTGRRCRSGQGGS